MTFTLENQNSPAEPSDRRWRTNSLAPPLAYPAVRELSPCPDPIACFRRLAGLSRVLFLDSALRRQDLGRYSYLAADPFQSLEVVDRQCIIDGRSQPIPAGTSPLEMLSATLVRFAARPLPDLPPFQGGAAGVFGYELSRYFERLPAPKPDDIQVPDLSVSLYDWVIAWDHLLARAWIISTGFPELDPSRRQARALARLKQVEGWLMAPMPESRCLASHSPTTRGGHALPGHAGLYSNFDADSYVDVVERAIEYIHAGDCFQANIAQRLFAPAAQHPIELYLRLRSRNAATFGGYFDQGEFVLASASPERFLRVVQGVVETRPIKGTRPRLQDPALDAEQKQALFASAKDRAENVMIVDLLRNDLGRVCSYGSIRVPTLCQVESYAYVHHLVSEVRGVLRPDRTPLDLLQAAFPGGSITGAPKIRAMEIIHELETCARGWYCGSLGFVGFDGSMDTNLLIRSFLIYPGGVQFSVGGGIVADSIPRREYDETWHKARGMLRALIP
jgi:para-aminobenzoate synthetase component 1